MAWTFCTSTDAQVAAGANASVISTSGPVLARFSDQAEGSIEQDTNTDWTSNYAALTTSMKNALNDVTASRIAKRIVSYDPTGYLTREADMLMNVNDDIETKGLKTLEGKSDKLKAP